jgi:hypothetical protein
MGELLKIEWLKIRRYTAFIVMSIFFIVAVIATNYIVYSVNKNMANNMGNAISMMSFSPYSFENTWQTTSYATGFILLLPSLLLVMLVTIEYTFKTHRQNIIDGLSRQQFISVKIMLALVFAVVSTLLVFITAICFGWASGTNFSLHGIEFVGFFFLKAITYNLIAILISVLIKRTGFATGVFFIYLGGENFVAKMLDLWSIKMKQDNGTDYGSLGDYLPMNAADGLLRFPKNPVTNMALNFMPTDYIWVILPLALVYLLVFYTWARRKFIHADL